MSTISGHINPLSSEFQKSANNFKTLSRGSKILTIFFSAVAFLVTLPFLGIGGYAAFRSLVDRLSPITRTHTKTTEKTDKAWRRYKYQRNRATKPQKTTVRELKTSKYQKELVEQLIQGLESELKTIEDYVGSDRIVSSLDRALDSQATLDDRRVCLKELSVLYNTYHYQIKESKKTAKDLVAHLKKHQQEELSQRLSTLETEYDVLGTMLVTTFAEQQAKIAKVFILVDTELRQDIDDQLQKFDPRVLEDYDGVTDFLSKVFGHIKDNESEQKAIDELKALDSNYGIMPFLATLFAYVIPAGEQTGIKKKIHDVVLEPIDSLKSKVRGEMNRRIIEKERLAQEIERQSSTSPERAAKRTGRSSRSRALQSASPGGLPNIGNTCYMNSSLQVILNSPKLSALIDRDIPEPIWSDFSEIELDDGVLAGYLSGTVVPTSEALKLAVGRYREAMEDHPRHMAHIRALRLVKNIYTGRLAKPDLRTALRQLKQVVSNPETRLVTIPYSYAQQDAAEFLTAALRGIGYSFSLRKTIRGDDGEHTSTVDEGAQYLSLPIIKKDRGKATFQELLDGYKVEHVDDPKNAWNVVNDSDLVIRQYQKYTNTYTIVDEIPEVLVVQLKRFDRTGIVSRKIGDLVEIGEEVDMRTLIDDSLLDDDTSTRYRVTGVVVHGGSLSGGHYTADVKTEDQWSSRSDSSVNKSPSTTSIKSNRERGYIYVLERI